MMNGLLDKTFASLKIRNFRLFFTGQSISLIGTWMHQTALSWLIYEMTGSKLLLGTIAALGSLPMLFLSIFGGVLADRVAKKKIIIATQAISMILAGIFSILVVLKIQTITHIFLISALLGITMALDMPARQAFLIDIAGKHNLNNAIALNSSMVNLARVLGPAAAGIIMVKLGIQWCFIINTISYFAVLISLFAINLKEEVIKETKESILEYTRSGFKYVKENTVVFNVMILMALMGIFGWSYAILLPAYAKDVFHQNEQGYSLLMSANGVGALLGALIVATLSHTHNKRKIMDWSIYFFSAMIFLLAINRIYWVSLIILMFAGMGLITYFSSSTSLIQTSINNEVRGRVMGIWTLIFGGMMPLGFFFAGAFSQQFGLFHTLLVSAFVCPIFTYILSVKLQPKDV